MGQEVSVPQSPGDTLEEQARAPPSAVNSDTNPSSSGRLVSTASNAGPVRSSRKIMGSMFRNSNNSSNLNGGNINHSEYEQREAVRAAAAGGQLYMTDGTSDDFLDGHTTYQQNQMMQQPYNVPPNFDSENANAENGYVGSHVAQHIYTESSQPNQPSQVSQQTKQPIVSVLYEKPSSAKKSLFSTRGTRSVINTMRNLTISGALRRQKEAADWENKWDEDDDSEGSDSEEGVTSPQHKGAGSPPGDIAQNSFLGTTPMASPPRSPKSPEDQTRLEHVNYISSHSQSPADITQYKESSIVTPTSPPKLHYFGAMPDSSISSPTGEVQRETESAQGKSLFVEDLLSKPVSDHLMVPNHDQYDAADNWDNRPNFEPWRENDKPNIQMFMPMLRVLGKGSFGKVVLVQKREGKERGQLFAMKILKKTHLVKRRQIERTRTERKVLSVVNHPFIMKLHYAFQSEDKLYLVLDYCPGGELFFHLSRFRRFPERVARFYAAELLLAIGHLHKRGIIYRDLKPENVLLDAEGHLKLGDFGLAKAGITHPLSGASSMCGTPEYMAPEVLAQSGHGFCVDYWGLGMILYEMMTGLPPWYTTDRAQLFKRLKSAPLDIPTYFSVSAANCVAALLERNPRRRLGVMGIRSAMEHEFYRNISWRSLYSRRVDAPVRPCEGWRPPEPICDDDDLLVQTDDGFSSRISPSEYRNGIEDLDSSELDTATQNFDNQFTRMPVESEDHPFDPASEGINKEELNEETFLGFSFDIVKHRESEAIASFSNSHEPLTSQTNPSTVYP